MEEGEPYHSGFLLLNEILFKGFELPQIAELVVLLLLFFISAMVSGSEVAYFSLTPNDIDSLKNEKSSTSKLIIRHLHVPDRLLASILIANNFVNIGIVVLAKFFTDAVFDFSLIPGWVVFLIQVVIVTFLILFFSELLPKIYANRYAVGFARFTAIGLKFMSKLFWPFATLLIKSTSIVNRKIVKQGKNISMDELSDALELTEGSLVEEKSLLKGIVKFGNIDVKEIMRSRVDVVSVSVDSSFYDLINTVRDSGYSRIPVFEETFDEVKGILYIKDLLSHLNEGDNYDWKKLLRPCYFVPENKKINSLLKEFQANRIHMAIVVDEYGGSSGIVTMEDILEEIVGEITDESDAEELPYQKIDSNNFLFEAKTLLNDFYKVFDIDEEYFDDVKGEADTLAGLILEFRGEIPKKDDKLTFKDFTFHIKDVDKRRIKKILTTIKKNSAIHESIS